MKKLIVTVSAFVLTFNNLNLKTFASEVINREDYLKNIKINEISRGVYSIEGTVVDMLGIKEINYNVWTTEEGKDDLEKERLNVENQMFSFIISSSNHGYESGEYNIEFDFNFEDGKNITVPLESLDMQFDDIGDKNDSETELYDNVEETKLVNISEKNMITDIKTNKTSSGSYVVIVTCNSPIKSIKFPTWTTANGQDDIIWGEGRIDGNKATYEVDIADHNFDIGQYNTHVYVEDLEGSTYIGNIEPLYMTNDAPLISDVKIQNDGDKYIITAKVSDDYKLDKVLFPTWTIANGQDDIIWGVGNIVGDTVTYIVDVKDHNFESGEYITHIYAYDKAEQSAVQELSTQMLKNKELSIEDINVSNEGSHYTITAKITGGYGIDKVLFPTWTIANGQDDIQWGRGTVVGDAVTYTVDIKDHNYESGDYITHIYAYDKDGNVVLQGIPEQTLKSKKLSISNVDVENDGSKYTVTAKISGGYGIDKVLFPTWTNANGQDDIQWGRGTVVGDTVTYTVDIKDHNYESGDYITHIYAYDKAGQVVLQGAPIQILKSKELSIDNVNIINKGNKYTVSAKIIGGYGIDKVLFPTWTNKNGQDDIVWGEGKITGDIATYTVDMGDHNYECGEYITHIYAYDKVGQVTMVGIPQQTIEVEPLKIDSVEISDVTAQGYLVTAKISGGIQLDKVLFPTWTTENGQDDIVWGNGTINGNTIQYRVNVSDHKYEFGTYETHVYIYDKQGNCFFAGAPDVNINNTSSIAGWNIVNGRKYLYDANHKIVGSGTMVIDISEHNGTIDWTAVKNAGVDAVILRSSYGYDTDSLNQMDKTFKRNISELNRLGIPYGIYHFSYARSESDGAEEAKYVLRCLQNAGARPTLPIYYDLEYSSYVGNKSNSFYAKITRDFARVIENAGYKVGVYANQNWWDTKLTDPLFNSYEKWIANYGTNANNAAGTANPNWHPDNRYKIWQYTSCGSVKGISTRVDMNILFNR